MSLKKNESGWEREREREVATHLPRTADENTSQISQQQKQKTKKQKNVNITPLLLPAGNEEITKNHTCYAPAVCK